MADKFEILGAASIVLGFIISLNSFEGITGNVVAGKIYGSFGSFFGLFFLILGIFVLVYSKHINSRKEVKSGVK